LKNRFKIYIHSSKLCSCCSGGYC